MTVRYHMGEFPPRDFDFEPLIPLIGKAHGHLARYDGILSAVPNSSILLSPLTTQEAVLSSKIEGTHVTMGEVLELEAEPDQPSMTQPRRDDIEEVINYRTALITTSMALSDRPLSQHLLREAHALLMRGVRGKDKSPGQYRVEQNWIGPRGCTIEQATFVPIPTEHLLAGMDTWTNFMANRNYPDPLVQLALSHIEFEALHPFMDGNGRLGRMFIPLFLHERQLLTGPNFYMSGYFEEHREVYIQRLRDVSERSAWTQWCVFFLEGVIAQATSNASKARAILSLYERVKGEVVNITRSQHALRAVDFLFQRLIFSATDFTSKSEIPKPTAARMLRTLTENHILKTIREASGRRPAIYVFRELLNTAEGVDIF